MCPLWVEWGIFDLYAQFTDTPRDEVRDELMRLLRKDRSGQERKQSVRVSAHVTPDIAESSAANIEIRHAAYSALMSALSLAQDHKKNLTRRGLSEKAVIENGYKTTPVVGGKMIAKRLMESGLRLDGVPGFYKDASGAWTFIEQRRGILVPVKDLCGRIQGLQTRCDNTSKRKYRWVSSADIEGAACGCGAEGWTHLAGPVREHIILIEGPMKADIVFHLTGYTVLAVPGVNSLRHLEHTLLELRERGVKHIMTAFDMDFLKNPHVQNGYGELVSLLARMGLSFGTYLWQPEYNGLDDYVWECCMKRGHAI